MTQVILQFFIAPLQTRYTLKTYVISVGSFHEFLLFYFTLHVAYNGIELGLNHLKNTFLCF